MRWLRKEIEDLPPGWLGPTVTAIRQSGVAKSVAKMAEQHILAIEAEEIPIPGVRLISAETLRIFWQNGNRSISAVFGPNEVVRLLKFEVKFDSRAQTIEAGGWRGLSYQSFDTLREHVGWVFPHANASREKDIEQAASLGGRNIGA